jgi:hypothetical protein
MVKSIFHSLCKIYQSFNVVMLRVQMIASGDVLAAEVNAAARMMQIDPSQKGLGYPALANVLFGIAVALC